jgi:hypothetical protein
MDVLLSTDLDIASFNPIHYSWWQDSLDQGTDQKGAIPIPRRKKNHLYYILGSCLSKKKKNRLNSKELFYSKYYLYQNWNFEHLLINNKTMAAFIFFFFLILFFSHKPWNHGLLFLFFSFLIFFNIFSVWWGWK